MIPLNKGSSLSQDSSLNIKPWENFYILGYKSLTEISQDVIDREWTVLYVLNILETEGETVTRGSLYKFTMLNSLETSHLGKTLITPNW